MTKISDERLAEMMAGLEGVTPGPWFADQLGDGSSDEWIVCAPNIEAVPVSGVKFRDDACHIGNCDPDTIRSILTELQQLRAHNSDSAEPVAQIYRWREKGSDRWKYSDVTPDQHDREWNEIHDMEPLYLASPPAKEVADSANFHDYDAGLLSDYGGGNVDWWMDYIRTEISRANEFWRVQVEALTNRTPDDEVGNG